MEIKSLADGQSLLKTWMEQKTDKPKFLICNEANAGGETTAQRLLTPLFDLNKVVLILTSNATGPHLPFHSRFEDRIAAHLEFSMNDGLREKVMTREIEKLEVKFNVKCTWASKTTIIGIAKEKGIRTALDQLEVSAYRSRSDGHKNLFIYSIIQ